MKQLIVSLIFTALGHTAFAQSQLYVIYSSGGETITTQQFYTEGTHTQGILNQVSSTLAFDFAEMADQEGWAIPDDGVDIMVLSTQGFGYSSEIHIEGGWTGTGNSISISWPTVSDIFGSALCAAGLSGCGGGGGGPLDLVY